MPDPVFVLAMPHCGAARVAAMLGMHTQAYGLPELNLFMADRLGELLSTFRRSESRLEDGGELAESFLQHFFPCGHDQQRVPQHRDRQQDEHRRDHSEQLHAYPP